MILVKPDAVARGLIGEVLRRYEQRGLTVREMKLLRMDREQAEAHYAEHAGKDFFAALVQYITAGPVVAAVIEGEGAIQAVRSTNGSTDPIQALPGTIRGDLGLRISCNLVHASDSAESAAREIKLFFGAADS